MSQQKTLVAILDQMAEQLSVEKTAAATSGTLKVAGPTPSDPGGHEGSSSHPTTSADNNCRSSQEGSRSSENASDVKEQVGGHSVDSTPDTTPDANGQDKLQPNQGTKQSTPGGDSAAENPGTTKLTDPGGHQGPSSHPSAQAEKYSSLSLKEACDLSTTLGNEILADLVNGFGTQLNKQAASAAATAPAASAAPAATSEMQAGYELAAALGLSKEAAQAQIEECLGHTILDAQLEADIFGGYWTNRMKRAAEEDGGSGKGGGEEGEDHSGPGDDSSGAGGAAAASPASPASPAAPGGGDPMAGGGPSDDQIMQELLAACQEMGISPQDLIQMLQSMGGGGAGGAPGGADPAMGGGAPPPAGPPGMAGGGGAPPMPEAPPADAGMALDGPKLAAELKAFQMAGKYEIKEASSKEARELRNQFKGFVREVMLTSKA